MKYDDENQADFNYFSEERLPFENNKLNNKSQKQLQQNQDNNKILVEEEEILQVKIQELKNEKSVLRKKRHTMKENIAQGCSNLLRFINKITNKRSIDFFEQINLNSQQNNTLNNFAEELFQLNSYKKVFDLLKKNWNSSKFKFKLLRNFSKLFKPIVENRVHGKIL